MLRLSSDQSPIMVFLELLHKKQDLVVRYMTALISSTFWRTRTVRSCKKSVRWSRRLKISTRTTQPISAWNVNTRLWLKTCAASKVSLPIITWPSINTEVIPSLTTSKLFTCTLKTKMTNKESPLINFSLRNVRWKTKSQVTSNKSKISTMLMRANWMIWNLNNVMNMKNWSRTMVCFKTRFKRAEVNLKK